MLSFTLRPLYSWKAQYPLDISLGEPQSGSERGGKEKSVPAGNQVFYYYVTAQYVTGMKKYRKKIMQFEHVIIDSSNQISKH